MLNKRFRYVKKLETFYRFHYVFNYYINKTLSVLFAVYSRNINFQKIEI